MPAAPAELELVSIAPNPVTAASLLSVRSSRARSATLRVYDMLGREALPARAVTVREGLTRLAFGAEKLRPGAYILTLGSGTYHAARIVVKR